MFKCSYRNRAVVIAALGLVALGLSGCAGLPTKTAGPLIMTGRVISQAEVRQMAPLAHVGDEAYAEVNSQGLDRVYTEFNAELFRLGVTKWNERFDCNRFAELYAGVAQTVFYRESMHQRTSAKALALGPFWYRPANGADAHAIVQILTEQGVIYIEPQTGARVQLTPAERASAFLQVM